MCSDTRACALGQEHVLNMSACAVGTVKSVGKGTACDEMLSQLKEVASSLLERQGVVFSGSTKLPGSLQQEGPPGLEAMESASASDTKKKDLQQLRSALEENATTVTFGCTQPNNNPSPGTQLGSEGRKVAVSRDAGSQRQRKSEHPREAQGIPQERGRPSGTVQGSHGELFRPRERVW